MGVRAASITALIATTLSSATAFASPSAKLVYVRGTGAETCPAEADLRRAVAVRIGYDPFFPVATKTVVAQVSKTNDGYRARVQIVAQDGTLRGERDLATKGQDCGELVGAIALAISVALDDLDDPPAAPPPSEPAVREEPVVPVPLPPPPAEKPPAPPPAISETPIDVALGAGVGAVVGTAPSLAATGNLALAIARGALAVRIDGRADLPAGTGIVPNGRLSTSSFVGIVSVCVRGSVPFVCAGGGPGAFVSSTEGLARPQSDSALLGLAALRIGAVIRPSKTVFVEPSLILGLNLVRHRVVVDEQTVFSLPIAWGGANVLVGLNFL